MILTIDSKIHHLKELDFIERELYGLFSPEEFYTDLRKFLQQNPDIDLRNKGWLNEFEVRAIDEYVKNYFFSRIPEAKTWYLRAYIVGRLTAESDLMGTVLSLAPLATMPLFVQTAAKEFGLSLHEAKMLEGAVSTAGMHITNTTQGTIQQIQTAISDALIRREGIQGIERRLNSMLNLDIGDLNRDWKRVAITETNMLFNDGYISSMLDGDYVIGVSMPDACDSCLNDINNKIYQVTAAPPPDYTELTGEAKKQAEFDWETKVWAGKNNIGRSASKRKRLDKQAGNAETNLRHKHHHEMSMPACPYHPHCRCRWIHFNPKFQWIDKGGNLRFAVEDPDAHDEWYKENIG
jgi:hypothetical protein